MSNVCRYVESHLYWRIFTTRVGDLSINYSFSTALGSFTLYWSGDEIANVNFFYRKIGYFALTLSLWSKISGRRGRFPPIIFARIVRPMNSLQLCRREFSHRCYGWGATTTSENRSKIGDFAPTRSLLSKISGTRGYPPPIIFAQFVRQNECLTTLLLTVFTQRNFVTDFLQAKCDFRRKSAVLRFWDPLWGT